MADEMTGTPGAQAGQAEGGAVAPETGTQGGQPDSGVGPDPFAFAGPEAGSEGQAPAQQPGQGAQNAGGEASPQQGTQQPAQSEGQEGQTQEGAEGGKDSTDGADGDYKSYLQAEFGGDVGKLDKAYSHMRSAYTRETQVSAERGKALNEAMHILNTLQTAIGPEIEQLLVQKGIVPPDQAQQPGQQVPRDPMDQPLTRRQWEMLRQQEAEQQAEFNNMVATFKSQNPDWEQFKPQISQVMQQNPQLATLITQRQVPMETLLHMARGMVYNERLNQARQSGLKEGLAGAKARQQSVVEQPGSAVGGGAGGDDWGFAD
jgi:hypothetical protein